MIPSTIVSQANGPFCPKVSSGPPPDLEAFPFLLLDRLGTLQSSFEVPSFFGLGDDVLAEKIGAVFPHIWKWRPIQKQNFRE